MRPREEEVRDPQQYYEQRQQHQQLHQRQRHEDHHNRRHQLTGSYKSEMPHDQFEDLYSQTGSSRSLPPRFF